MPLKTIKKETAEHLTLEWVLHIKDYKLVLDRKRCVGCQVCSLACPKEAIRIDKQPRIGEDKAKKAKIDVDLAKCNFCGICDVLCPYGAIRVTLDGQHNLPVVEKESFPQLIRDLRVDASKCPIDCVKCEEMCPLKLIKVSHFAPNGTSREHAGLLSEQKRGTTEVKIDVLKEYCPCCKVCEAKCPKGVIQVRKFLYGKITIHDEKCPKGCEDCLDVCPITGALHLSEKDQKVHVNEIFCIYCGACKLVCPVEAALDLKRTRISHSPIRSGAWNKALEKLASPTEISKELKTKGSLKARESVRKRIGLKGD